MYKNVNKIFIILALIALTIILVDYTCGHMHENPLESNGCPLCQAHQSSEVGFCSILFYISLGFILTGILLNTVEWVIPSLFFLRNITHRAPPYTS
jgi:hypothetical protein